MAKKGEIAANRIYKTASEMKNRIDEYFTSLQVPQLYFNKRENRNELLTDKLGNIIFHQPTPATISGLCRYLGFMSRQRLYDYEKMGGAWQDSIACARMRIEQDWTERLTEKDSAKGAEFYLRCRCAWISEETKRDLEIKEKQSGVTATIDDVCITVQVGDCSK